MQYNIGNLVSRALLAFVFLIVLVTTIRGETVSPITPCSLKDTNNGPCLTELFQKLLLGSEDIPGVKQRPSVDPYKIKRVLVAIDNPTLNVNLALRKVSVSGLSQAKLSDASAIQGETIKFTLKIPKLHVKGGYNLTGRLLVLNLDGKGPIEVDMTDVDMDLNIKIKPVERDGVYYIDFLSAKSNVKDIGGMNIQFKNLFGDNVELNESANNVINQNWRALIDLGRPVIIEAVDSTVLTILKTMFNQIPAHVLLLDIP